MKDAKEKFVKYGSPFKKETPKSKAIRKPKMSDMNLNSEASINYQHRIGRAYND